MPISNKFNGNKQQHTDQFVIGNLMEISNGEYGFVIGNLTEISNENTGGR